MKLMVFVGTALVIIGLIGLIYGGITYTKNKETVDLGPIDVSITEKERLNIHPAIGGLILVAGAAVLVVGSRKRSS